MAYHHGDLRNALIQAGVEMLHEVGPDALSLRKLAKQAGVSHNAPYMHFADKEALLAAITEEGFHLLSQRLDEAIGPPAGDWHVRFEAGCVAYVHFVLSHTAHTQVMFRRYEPSVYPEAVQAALGALARLENLLEAGQASGHVTAGDHHQLAVLVWTTLHGLSMMLASRKIPPAIVDERPPDVLTRDFVRQLYAGLQP